MNPALLILLYAFVFAVLLIIVIDPDQGDQGVQGRNTENDPETAHLRVRSEGSAEVESTEVWGGDSGSRIGDHVIANQSDSPDFDSFSDSWDDSWGRDD